MAIVEFTVIPIVKESLVNEIVDRAIKVVEESGLNYEVGANGTTIEGDLERVFEVVKKAHSVARDEGSGRVYTIIKIDDKLGGITIEEKVKKFRKEKK
ncbi:MAG: MTH1187 family thiamine-binding protein [Caldisericaceae bacterium]